MLSTQHLIQSISTHLTAPASTTLKAYQSVAAIMANDLQSDDFVLARQYFLSRFPEIQLVAWKEDLDVKRPLLWGEVDKGETDNRIYIRKDVVVAYESACERDLESMWTLSLILLVVVLHELSHAMTKDLFNGAITPGDVKSDPFISNTEGKELNLRGESGWVIEDLVFGFNLLVEWKLDDRGDMEKIRRLLAQAPDGGTRVITPQDARRVVESLKDSELHKIDFQALQPAPNFDAEVFRARDSQSNNSVTKELIPSSSEKSIYHSSIRCGIRPQFRNGTLVSAPPSMTRDEVTGGDRLLAPESDSKGEDQVF